MERRIDKRTTLSKYLLGMPISQHLLERPLHDLTILPGEPIPQYPLLFLRPQLDPGSQHLLPDQLNLAIHLGQRLPKVNGGQYRRPAAHPRILQVFVDHLAVVVAELAEFEQLLGGHVHVGQVPVGMQAAVDFAVDER